LSKKRMPNYRFRLADQADEEFLWEMLFYAANMSADGISDYRAAKENAFLRPYVEAWGHESDYGVLAIDQASGEALGAAWVRLLSGDEHRYSGVSAEVPELAIAVKPSFQGRGLGSQLLSELLRGVTTRYSQVVLSVREQNPAYRLYQRHGFQILSETSNRVGGRSFVMLWTSQGDA
jgi:ribosomal protein S18 acetylase RimI-like enzyme